MRYAPSPRSVKKGCPPTDANERTGEFTPPGIRATARSYQSVTTSPRSGMKELGDLVSEVREDDVGAGALDRDQMLERDRFTVEPTELRGGLHHRVLTAHVVRRQREGELRPDRRDHVEVRERRLHH